MRDSRCCSGQRARLDEGSRAGDAASAAWEGLGVPESVMPEHQDGSQALRDTRYKEVYVEVPVEMFAEEPEAEAAAAAKFERLETVEETEAEETPGRRVGAEKAAAATRYQALGTRKTKEPAGSAAMAAAAGKRTDEPAGSATMAAAAGKKTLR